MYFYPQAQTTRAENPRADVVALPTRRGTVEPTLQGIRDAHEDDMSNLSEVVAQPSRHSPQPTRPITIISYFGTDPAAPAARLCNKAEAPACHAWLILHCRRVPATCPRPGWRLGDAVPTAAEINSEKNIWILSQAGLILPSGFLDSKIRLITFDSRIRIDGRIRIDCEIRIDGEIVPPLIPAEPPLHGSLLRNRAFRGSLRACGWNALWIVQLEILFDQHSMQTDVGLLLQLKTDTFLHSRSFVSVVLLTMNSTLAPNSDGHSLSSRWPPSNV
jgi:hypothetical protein